MAVVTFYEKSHTYWHNEKKMHSVGRYFGQFLPKYDREYWLTYKAIKELFGGDDGEFMQFKRKQFGKTPKPPAELLFPFFLAKVNPGEFYETRERLENMWEHKQVHSSFTGTRFHKLLESQAAKTETKINPFTGESFPIHTFPTEYDNQSVVDDLAELADGFYSELILWNLPLNVAGQADEVYVQSSGGKRYIDINDSKTNEKPPEKTSWEKWLPPLQYLDNSKHVRYNMQISWYAYLLELAGYEVRNLGYTHYKNYDTLTGNLVKLDYIRNEVLLTISG